MKETDFTNTKSVLSTEDIIIQIDSSRWKGSPESGYWLEGITLFIPYNGAEGIYWNKNWSPWKALRNRILDNVIKKLDTLKRSM